MKVIFFVLGLVVCFNGKVVAADFAPSIAKVCEKQARFKPGLCLNPQLVENYLIFSRAAYTEGRQQVLGVLKKNGWSYFLIDNQAGLGAGLLAFKGNTVIVAYHGTESLVDWAVDINARTVSASDLGLRGDMHKGFKTASDSTWSRFRSKILDHIKTAKLDPKNIEYFAIGHSLGGALASIAGIRIINDSDLVGPDHNNTLTNQVKIITIGSPRVFVKDTSGPDYMAKMGNKNVLRFWNSGDPVAAVPMGSMGFKHVGTSIRLSDMSQVYAEVKDKKTAKQVVGHFADKHKTSSYEEQVSEVFSAYQKKPITHKGFATRVEECKQNICKLFYTVVGKP